MDLSGLQPINTPAALIIWLQTNCITPIRPEMSGSDLGTILQKVITILEGVEVSISDAIIAAPVLNNEAAAIQAGLAPYTFYKTATGELRYKLPATSNNAFTYTLPFTLS